MLRYFKRMAGNYIKSQGYRLSRPLPAEIEYSRSFWKEFLGKDPLMFAGVYSDNRNVLADMDVWFTTDMLKNSIWRYGVPIEWEGHFNSLEGSGLQDIEAEITAADLLVFLGKQLGHVNYFEIGVSLGKNLLQISRAFPSARLTGLDVEEISPQLAAQFDGQQTVWTAAEKYDVNSLAGAPVSKLASLTRLKHGQQVFNYLSADQFRPDSWERLKGNKFNLIFSDGSHTPEALLIEFQYLTANDLIDRSGTFAMFWDDLHGEHMQGAFTKIAGTLCEMFDTGRDSISLYELHGSYGYKRPMGLFTNIEKGTRRVSQ